MVTKGYIIWSLIGVVTGTTAYQAYENRQELIDAAGLENTIQVADSLEALAPPDPNLAPPDLSSKEGKDMLDKVSGYLDSARGSLQRSNAKSCEGYCNVKRNKCVKVANREKDLEVICQDEYEICFKGCHADEMPVANSLKGTGE